MLSYFELNELLTNVGAEINAAECHGFLCGQICILGYPHEELWQEFIDAQSNDDDVLYDCYREITLLLEDMLNDIRSSDLDFQLLLPGDSCSLQERVEALSEWCHGFLNGYGSGIGEQSLTADSREILEDISKICQVDAEAGVEEEDEQALQELIEYVRMGTISIYIDHAAAFDARDELGLLH